MQLRQVYNMPNSGLACSLDKAELLFFNALGRVRQQKCRFNPFKGASNAGAVIEIRRGKFYICNKSFARPDPGRTKARTATPRADNCLSSSRPLLPVAPVTRIMGNLPQPEPSTVDMQCATQRS